jgi:hypothetical protein
MRGQRGGHRPNDQVADLAEPPTADDDQVDTAGGLDERTDRSTDLRLAGDVHIRSHLARLLHALVDEQLAPPQRGMEPNSSRYCRPPRRRIDHSRSHTARSVSGHFALPGRRPTPERVLRASTVIADDHPTRPFGHVATSLSTAPRASLVFACPPDL